VWKCLDNPNSRFWFKSKCEAHTVSGRMPSRNRQQQTDKVHQERTFASDFAKAHLTPARLQQGLDVHHEMGRPLDKASCGQFVGWLVSDILKEEGEGLSEAQEKKCRGEISQLAAKWYFQHVAELTGKWLGKGGAC
jgi:hypothetical protein